MAHPFNHIAIEGVIGAGKTELAMRLAEKRDGRLVLEEFEENPFLPRFYEDRGRYAFPTQLSFLASRFRQQQKLRNLDLFQNFVISDYLFEKDRIFALLNLNEDELALYDTIYQIMTGIAVRPDLVIYLQSTVEGLMRNIRKRNREYEKHITEEYLSELNDAYNDFFHHYNKSPLMVINASEIDFVNNPDHLAWIEKQIFEQPIRPRTHLHILPD